MRLVLVVTALLCLSFCSCQKVKVFIGGNPTPSPDTLNASVELLQNRIPLAVVGGVINIYSFSEIENAINDGMQALLICSEDGSVSFDNNVADLIDSFVLNGGILIYSASDLDSRAEQASIWLSDPLLNVTSTKPDTSPDYLPFLSYVYGFNYLAEYVSFLTKQAISSSFARIANPPFNNWGSNYHWLTSVMYWVDNYTYQMELTELNEQYCMFKREMPYIGAVLDEACWVFNFPHGDGYVVELAFSFSDPGFFNEDFSSRTISLVEAALGQYLEEDLFETFDNSVILYYPSPFYNYQPDDSFKNIGYDLSLVSNVYVFGVLQYPYNILNVSATSIIFPPFEIPAVAKSVSKRMAEPVHTNIYDFVVNGGNFVSF